jgi:hypothetical protein
MTIIVPDRERVYRSYLTRTTNDSVGKEMKKARRAQLQSVSKGPSKLAVSAPYPSVMPPARPCQSLVLLPYPLPFALCPYPIVKVVPDQTRPS